MIEPHDHVAIGQAMQRLMGAAVDRDRSRAEQALESLHRDDLVWLCRFQSLVYVKIARARGLSDDQIIAIGENGLEVSIKHGLEHAVDKLERGDE